MAVAQVHMIFMMEKQMHPNVNREKRPLTPGNIKEANLDVKGLVAHIPAGKNRPDSGSVA
jgi:hypothetical protein